MYSSRMFYLKLLMHADVDIYLQCCIILHQMITNLLICSTIIRHLHCSQLFVFINKVALTLLKLSPSACGQVYTVHNRF